MRSATPFEHVSLAAPFDRCLLHPPDIATRFPGQIVEHERRFLYGVARDLYGGEGRIVDAGILLGASTACLAKGIEARPGPPPRPVVAIERARLGPSMAAAFRGWGVPCDGEPGSSFESLVRERLEPMASLVELRIGDLAGVGVVPEPIEVLHLDVMMAERTAALAFATFAPHLIPGRALVIHRGYLTDDRPFINARQVLLSDAFALVGEIGQTAVFRCTAPVTPAMMGAVEEQLTDPSFELDAVRRSVLHTHDPWRRLAIELSAARLAAGKLGLPRATALFEDAVREYRDVLRSGGLPIRLQNAALALRDLSRSPGDGEALRACDLAWKAGAAQPARMAAEFGATSREPPRRLRAGAVFRSALSLVGKPTRLVQGRRPEERPNGSTCLVAIARDEARALPEWLAHHLAIGFDRIVVYDHGSNDGTDRLLDGLATRFPVTCVPFRSARRLIADRPYSGLLRRAFGYGCAPQMLAYNHALDTLGDRYEWMAFFDLDEFLVLRDGSPHIAAFLAAFPTDVGAVRVNWLTFGSGGRLSRDYDLVTQAFRTGGPRDWGHNRFYKSIVRPNLLDAMLIHDGRVGRGRRVHASGVEIPVASNRSATVDHGRAQLNHYQVKSAEDWARKIGRGRSGSHVRRGDTLANAEQLFVIYDRNTHAYDDIDVHQSRFAPLFRDMIEHLNGRETEPYSRLNGCADGPIAIR